jgi:hypothetical protein
MLKHRIVPNALPPLYDDRCICASGKVVEVLRDAEAGEV